MKIVFLLYFQTVLFVAKMNLRMIIRAYFVHAIPKTIDMHLITAYIVQAKILTVLRLMTIYYLHSILS